MDSPDSRIDPEDFHYNCVCVGIPLHELHMSNLIMAQPKYNKHNKQKGVQVLVHSPSAHHKLEWGCCTQKSNAGQEDLHQPQY